MSIANVGADFVSGDLDWTNGCGNPITTFCQNAVIPQTFQFCTCGCGTESKTITVDHKIQVMDAWAVLKGCGAACDTVQVFNGCNAITDAMDISGSDKAIVRATEIDDAQHQVAAGGTLKVTETDAAGCNSPALTVYVTARRVS